MTVFEPADKVTTMAICGYNYSIPKVEDPEVLKAITDYLLSLDCPVVYKELNEVVSVINEKAGIADHKGVNRFPVDQIVVFGTSYISRSSLALIKELGYNEDGTYNVPCPVSKPPESIFFKIGDNHTTLVIDNYNYSIPRVDEVDNLEKILSLLGKKHKVAVVYLGQVTKITTPHPDFREHNSLPDFPVDQILIDKEQSAVSRISATLINELGYMAGRYFVPKE